MELSSFSILFQNIFWAANSDPYTVRIFVVLFIAAQLTTRSEYQPFPDYVTTTSRGSLTYYNELNVFGIKIPIPVTVPDNACNRANNGLPIECDFVVVGAGASGATLARQLVEINNPVQKVCLIEAGTDRLVDSIVPYFFPFIENTTSALYPYFAVRSDKASMAFKHGTPIIQPKHFGGGTATNAMLFVCGNDRDYDRWVSKYGCTGWDFWNVTYYMKQNENNQDPNTDNTFHGRSGDLTTSYPPVDDYLVDVLKNAWQQLGYPLLFDHAAGYFHNYTGFTRLPMTIRQGERCSSDRAFLVPVRDYPNFFIFKNSEVVKINFNGTKAVSVNVRTNCSACSTYTVKIKKELILSAGAINTPKLLMLSGVGDKNELQAVNVPVVKDLPAVGKNLGDHFYHVRFYSVNPDGPRQTNLDLLSWSEQFYFSNPNRTGPLSYLGVVNYHTFVNTTANSTVSRYPDQQFTPNKFQKGQKFAGQIFSNADYEDEFTAQIIKFLEDSDLLMYWAEIVNPVSRGSVKIKSNDSNDHPIIDMGYFEGLGIADADTIIRGDAILQQLMETPAMQAIQAKKVRFNISECNHLSFPSEEYDRCELKYLTSTGWHVCGTCAMGSDPASVVDPTLRLRGFDNVRIADASIMPEVPSGNTQCPCYMIGRKAAAIIKAFWGFN